MHDKRLIFSPRWTKPEPLAAGGSFQILIAGSCPLDTQFFLSDGHELSRIPVEQGTARAGFSEVRALEASLPGDLPLGLYDLHLFHDNRPIAVEPHCLWLRDPEKQCFTCAHISDLHIAHFSNGALEDFFLHIAATIQPDLIINTGDIINRYKLENGFKKPVLHQVVLNELHRARELFLKHRIPHFVTPGNHDIAFPYIHREWMRLMGGPVGNARDDYAFSQGDVEFIAVDRAVVYDADHISKGVSMSDQQHELLLGRLRTMKPGRTAVIFCHYDYNNELSPYLLEYPIYKILHGHSSKPTLDPEFADYDGGVSPYHCQTLKFSPDTGLSLGGKMKIGDISNRA